LRSAKPGALIIVGPLGDLSREHWMAAIKRLRVFPMPPAWDDARYRGLFIDAQHDGMGWRRHMKADNIAHLVDKIRVG
jgi:hypothetical protein